MVRWSYMVPVTGYRPRLHISFGASTDMKLYRVNRSDRPADAWPIIQNAYSSARVAFILLAAHPEPTGLKVEQTMTEDNKFANWLATGYHDSDLRWDHENYESEALLRYKRNDVVYLVWLDNAKPDGVDFMLCKNHMSHMRATQRRRLSLVRSQP